MEHAEAYRPQRTTEKYNLLDMKPMLTMSAVMGNLDTELEADGEIVSLFSCIQTALKSIYYNVNHYKLGKRVTNDPETFGALVTDLFVKTMTDSGCCFQLYTKNSEVVATVPEELRGDFLVSVAGLVGVENLDANLPTATLFTVYRHTDRGRRTFSFTNLEHFKEDCLVASGYALYSTTIDATIAVEGRIMAFSYDSVVGEFVLSEKDLRVPEKGKIMSVNEGYSGLLEPQILEFIRRKKDPKLGKPLKARFTGNCVADFHLLLGSGGIILMPGNRRSPQGELSLLCEVIPLAYLIKCAKGLATTGKVPILSVVPDLLVQKSPVFLGSSDFIKELLLFTKSPNES